MAEQECPKCPPEGLPAWMGTFADLMSLLMCFFVLLLSFSEMDVLKFKQGWTFEREITVQAFVLNCPLVNKRPNYQNIGVLP